MTRVSVDAEALAGVLRDVSPWGWCLACDESAQSHADDCPVPTLQAALAEAQGGGEVLYRRVERLSGQPGDMVRVAVPVFVPVDPTPPQPQPAPEVERLLLEWVDAEKAIEVERLRRREVMEGNGRLNTAQHRARLAEGALWAYAAALASSRGEG